MRNPSTNAIAEEQLSKIEVTGYANQWSTEAGSSIEFMVNCDGPDTYRADILKVICGDLNPNGPGYQEELVETPINGHHTGRHQKVHTGSHIEIPHRSPLTLGDQFTLQAMVYPTLPRDGPTTETVDRQGILTKWSEVLDGGYGLFVGPDGELEFQIKDESGASASVSSGEPLTRSMWHFVAATVDDGEVILYQEALPESERDVLPPDEEGRNSVEQTIDITSPGDTEVPVLMAAYATDNGRATGHFSGKIDQPRIADRVLDEPELKTLIGTPTGNTAPEGVVAAWDFSAEITSDGINPPDAITDVGPNSLHGKSHQLPTRAVTGYNWTGETTHYVHAPDQYGAIHFHEDDLADAGWDVDIEWDVPAQQESGVYALRLRTDDDEYYIPFYVRPPRGTSTANIAFLAPTNSYLAYANCRDPATVSGWPNIENSYGSVTWWDEHDLALVGHDYGLSCYDEHSDGSGSMYSSRLRPILSMSPKVMHWGGNPSHLHSYNADTHLIHWLEEFGYDYDVITDEDVEAEGTALLERYNVILTGNQPEYTSSTEWDAIREYQDTGGRIMYLGGNGFYWPVAHHPEIPQIIEVRRNGFGSGSWVTKPGEEFMSFDGQKGGIWRRRNQQPQKLVGIGFCAQWEPRGTHYRRNSASYEDEVAFVFDGVDGDTFGNFGYLAGGAAGQELDRYDTELGSPEHAYVLASSEDHSKYVRQVREELTVTERLVHGRMNPRVRADMVYYKTNDGGGVFSVGSMSWIGSLGYNGCDNAVSKITENVLDRFKSDGDLP